MNQQAKQFIESFSQYTVFRNWSMYHFFGNPQGLFIVFSHEPAWLRQAQNALMVMLKSAPDTYLRVQTILAKTFGRCISQVKE